MDVQVLAQYAVVPVRQRDEDEASDVRRTASERLSLQRSASEEETEVRTVARVPLHGGLVGGVVTHWHCASLQEGVMVRRSATAPAIEPSGSWVEVDGVDVAEVQ